MKTTFRLITTCVLFALTATGCGSTRTAAPQTSSTPSAGPGRGFPTAGPWASFYGAASDIDLDRLAANYRIINVDADPGFGNFTAGQIAELKAGGRNRVISYLNLGAIERSRDYWSHAPPGLVPAGKNNKAWLGSYDGYPDEIWMNPSDPDWQRLVLGHIAPRLVGQGVDGFYFDNLEVIEHRTAEDGGRCDPKCAQGGLELVARLRARYPRLLFVMQNATGEQALHGKVNGVPFPALLDGVAHEDTFTTPSEADDAEDAVYRVRADKDTVQELKDWQAKGLRPGGRPFWIATEDYVNGCGNTEDAKTVIANARANGFSPYVSDKSSGQNTVCHWGGLKPA